MRIISVYSTGGVKTVVEAAERMRRSAAARTILLLALAGSAGGCHISRVRRAELTANLVNDSNTLLTVEGKTNLPDGAEIEAILSDLHGRRLAYERGKVSHGHYFVVLDISRAPGFRPLSLDIFFDPVTASAQVQSVVGPRGEAMSGPLVEESHDRQLVLLREQVMLQMNAREAFLRKLQSGDGDMDELELLLARHPDDPEVLIGLGLAYLKQRPSERHPGSQADVFLHRGIAGHPRSRQLELQARLWLDRLDAEARAAAEELARKSRSQPQDPFHTLSDVRPGEGMGAFNLGMPSRFVFRHFQLDHDPGDAPANTTVEVFGLKDVAGMELGVDLAAGNVTMIGTTDPRYHTRDGIRVGSLLSEVQALMPGLRVSYGPEETRADGRIYKTGTAEMVGLVLTFESSTNPVFPIPVEKVSKIQVVPVGAAPAATPSPVFTPSIEDDTPGVPRATMTP